MEKLIDKTKDKNPDFVKGTEFGRLLGVVDNLIISFESIKTLELHHEMFPVQNQEKRMKNVKVTIDILKSRSDKTYELIKNIGQEYVEDSQLMEIKSKLDKKYKEIHNYFSTKFTNFGVNQ